MLSTRNSPRCGKSAGYLQRVGRHDTGVEAMKKQYFDDYVAIHTLRKDNKLLRYLRENFDLLFSLAVLLFTIFSNFHLEIDLNLLRPLR